jgi:hypothetical protein
MSSDNVVRIVVRTDFGARSNVWRTWTRNDELYVAERSVAHELKTSPHSSGVYHHPRVSGRAVSRDSRTKLNESLISGKALKAPRRGTQLFEFDSATNNAIRQGAEHRA